MDDDALLREAGLVDSDVDADNDVDDDSDMGDKVDVVVADALKSSPKPTAAVTPTPKAAVTNSGQANAKNKNANPQARDVAARAAILQLGTMDMETMLADPNNCDRMTCLSVLQVGVVWSHDDDTVAELFCG